MIIECKNCHKKFTVKDIDIPIKGRTVQCGNCSTQWLQMPITSSVTTEDLVVEDVDKKLSKTSSSVTSAELNVDDTNQDLSTNELRASDGKKYKYLGNQWAELLPSGKAGKLARKKISAELNSLTGKKQTKTSKTFKKSNQSASQYDETEGGGMGAFSFLAVLAISFAAIILVLDTFKNQLIPFFPNLDNYLVYIFETINNIYIIIKDLFNNYK